MAALLFLDPPLPRAAAYPDASGLGHYGKDTSKEITYGWRPRRESCYRPRDDLRYARRTFQVPSAHRRGPRLHVQPVREPRDRPRPLDATVDHHDPGRVRVDQRRRPEHRDGVPPDRPQREYERADPDRGDDRVHDDVPPRHAAEQELHDPGSDAARQQQRPPPARYDRRHVRR